MGKLERTIFKNYREGDQIPERVLNAPELTMGLELFYNGFHTLQSTRGALYASEGPIPWLAMKEYCDEYEIYSDQRLDFYELVSHMDAAYLEFKAKKVGQNLPPP